MEGKFNPSAIIEAAYCDGRGIQRLKMIKLATFSNYNLNWYSKLKPPSKSNSVILPESLRTMLLGMLKEGGFGCYVKCFPHDIDGILLPTTETHIWQLLIYEGDIAIHKQQVPSQFKLPMLFSETNKLSDLLTKECLFSNSKFIISKSHNQIAASVSDFESEIALDMSITDRSLKYTTPELTVDPLTFLTERYFSMLYNQHSMLSYFAKSSVPKLQLLCNNDPKYIFELLDKCLVTDTNELHLRYASINNFELCITELKKLWPNTVVTINKERETFYKECVCDKLAQNISAGVKLVSSELFMNYWKGLQVKETKLQIILALELLKIISSNSEIFKITSNAGEIANSNINKKPAKRKRPILVGKKKTLMPTLLGTVIPTNINSDFDLKMQESQRSTQRSSNTNNSRTAESVKELISRLFDDLTVNDALAGVSHKEPASAYSFIVTCLIPFYEKDHLSFLKELVCRARGASYLVKRKTRKDKERKRKEKEKSRKLTTIASDDLNDLNPSESKNEGRKEGSVISISDLKLRRTHSSIGSKVDWDRKGFDMIKNSSTFVSTTKQLDSEVWGSFNSQNDIPSVQPRSQTLGGFMTSIKRKRELKPNSAQMSQTAKEPQTPKKIKERLSLLNDMFANEQQIKNGDIIEATPRKKDGISLLDYKNQQRKLETTGMHSQVANESPFQIEATSSPMKKGSKRRKLGVGSVIVSETPIKQGSKTTVNSSPIKFGEGKALRVVEETPKMERVEIKPGIFEINSSPLKSPGGKTPKKRDRMLQYSSLKLTELSTLMKRNDTNIISETSSSPTKSQKTINRRLDFS